MSEPTIHVPASAVRLDKLRELGEAFDIADADTKDRPTIVKELRKKLAPTQWLAAIGILMAFLAAAGTWFGGCQAWRTSIAASDSSKAALESLNTTLVQIDKGEKDRLEEERKQKVVEWQRITVYKIIEKGFFESRQTKGMTLDDIKGRYVAEAATVQGIDLKREELQGIVLEKILLALRETSLVFQTIDHTYIVNTSILNPRFDRAFVEDRAKLTIINLLVTDGGKYTPSEVGQLVVARANLTLEEYYLIFNNLIGLQMICVEDDGRVYCASHPKRKQKHGKE